MNVKVKRTSLIASLKKAVKVRESAIAAYDKAYEEYRKALEEREEAIKAYVAGGKAKIVSVTHRYHANKEALVTVALPSSLTSEIRLKYDGVTSHKEEVLEIKSAIALLELSEEDVVNAATYKNVAKYLA